MKRLCYNKKDMEESVKKGFTLVELSLSLVFIGVLSLTIAMIINDTVGTYRRGVTLNLINTVGMDIVDDMKSAVQNSSAYSPKYICEGWYDGTNVAQKNDAQETCIKNGGQKFVHLTNTVKIENGTETDEIVKLPVSGVFCTGEYSYLWNSGYFFTDYTNPAIGELDKKEMVSLLIKPKVENGYQNDQPYEGFRLLKVNDPNREVCKSAISKNDYAIMDKKDDGSDWDWRLFEVGDRVSNPVEILANDGNNSSMALYDLEVFGPATNVANNSVFYSVSFVLGTLEGGANVLSKGNLCATPNDYKNENFDYCAINKFNFAVEALGEINEG